MHPIMSDLDISIRQFEHHQAREAFQQQMRARDVARRTGRQSLFGRLADAIHEFIDPRGFALGQVRQADLQHGIVGTMQVPVSATPARIHIFRTRTHNHQPQAEPLRKAA